MLRIIAIYTLIMDLGISGKAAIVTGGSRGIGKAIARCLAAEGVRVAICARGLEALETAAAEISSATHVPIIPVQADVTQPEDVKKFVSQAISTFGELHILVNNAASFRSLPFLEMTDQDWLNHLNVKLLGYIRCAREVIPHMKQHRWGRIISLGGGAARGGGGYSSGLVNSAIVNCTKKLSDELGPYGITVNAIHPGPTRTQRRAIAAARQGITLDEAEKQLIKRVPIGRLIEPEDIAYAVLYLASERANAVTGQVFSVDGGATRGVYY